VIDAHTTRAALLGGRLRGQALLDRIRSVPPDTREAWTDSVLGLPEAPPDESLPRGAVPYLPAAIDDVLAALAGVPVGPTDVFVDIGSGLGRVVLLAHLLTGAKGVGIEIQKGLVQAARHVASELGLADVSFRRADAAELELEGTVFFLYSPLTGEPLRRVLISLRNLAERQRIVICTVGLSLHHESWLSPRADLAPGVGCYDAGPPAQSLLTS